MTCGMTVNINGMDINASEIDRVTWNGRQTVRGMVTAREWYVVLADGSQYPVNPDNLSDLARTLLLDVVFPG